MDRSENTDWMVAATYVVLQSELPVAPHEKLPGSDRPSKGSRMLAPSFSNHREDLIGRGESDPMGLGNSSPQEPSQGKPAFFGSSEIGRASCRERVCQYVYISV